jgi:glycosyltransferase involved in cell wall biosynthesis
MPDVTMKGRESARIPPGWPVAEDPLRIAILGWARLSLQGREGSGYNLSASELAAGLAMSGHRVFYMRSGMDYVLGRGLHAKPVEGWRGVECWDAINSPNLSPAAMNFRNMRTETSSPRQARFVLNWLDRVDAQVVHIHSLEGYGLDLIGAVRDSGRPVIVTLHNYWFVCPQVDLLHEEKRVCTDYRGGERCVGCLEARSSGHARARRLILQTLERVAGPELLGAARSLPRQSVHRLRILATGSRGSVDREAPDPDPELSSGMTVTDAETHDGTINHGLEPVKESKIAKLGEAPLDQNERFLEAEHHVAATNEYGRRRLAGVEALNRASLVTPPSDFLRRVHVSMGVDEQRTRHVRLGQPHFDQINRRARRSPYYDVRPWDPGTARRPLRFGFFGTTRNNKGLDVLIRAIPLLDKDVRQRCQFLIRAGGWDWDFRRRVSAFPEVQFAGGYDLLQLIGAGGEYDVGVLCHVWFENSPLVMLEHLHAGKFVLTPRLGGPADWIEPPRNGMFFRAGVAEDLASCITELVQGGVSIPSPREVHDASTLRSYPDHVREVESIYREFLALEGADDERSSARLNAPEGGRAPEGVEVRTQVGRDAARAQ